MARSLNSVLLIGNLTRDPQLRYTGSGRPVCDIGLATNRQWKTESGEKKEDTEFHKIVLWGKLAEIASQYLQKGMKVYFQGRIQTRSYTGSDGIQKQATEIIAEDMIMLSGDPSQHKPKDTSVPQSVQTKQPREEGEVTDKLAEFGVNPDEIPF